MQYQPYYITDYEQNSGFENYYESFLLPEKAFPLLEDAYCWRGKIKRRLGVYLLGRLRRQYVSTDPAPPHATLPYTPLAVTGVGNYAVADVLAGVRATEPNAEIDSTTRIIVTINRAGPATTYQDDGLGNLVLTGGGIAITSGTINYVTGALALNFVVPPGAGLTVDINLYYYPALPVMGLETEEIPNIYLEKLVPFDTKYAYQYNYNAQNFEELNLSYPTVWGGTDAQLFWTTNYWYTTAGDKIFWATNNNPAGGDPIRWYTAVGGWTVFVPALGGGVSLQQAECLIPFKGRLLAFNTWEGIAAPGTNFPNRVRWSQIGDPGITPASILTAWLTGPGAGGFLDAPTDENIVSVEPLKDVILVKFERSSWKLIYTGNETQPFIFQRINFTFGAQATHSLVPFDDGVFAVARNAITTDDTTTVNRIDVKIPDQVFRMVNLSANNLPPPTSPGNRIYGIRDYINEIVYWSFQDSTIYSVPTSSVFNNKVLVLNYRNNSYATFNDSFSCYGYFQSLRALTIDLLQNVPNIVAGNQQGFVFVLNLASKNLNDPSLAITAITPGAPLVLTVPNHNFSVLNTSHYYVRIDGIIGNGPNSPANLNYATTPLIYRVLPIGANTIQLLAYSAITDDFTTPVTFPAGGTYLGAGTLTVLQNFDIKTKVFCPFYEKATKQRLPYVDLLIDATANGQCTCLVYENEASPAINATSNSATLGSNIVLTTAENAVLVPQQTQQEKIWHRFYIQSICQNFQLEFTMSNAQMASQAINDNTFTLHAMTFYLSPTARLIQ